jgi:prevent-host-death family protein
MTMELTGGLVRDDLVIGAGEFKARCLQLMDEVSRDGVELVITKRGRPVAKLVPVTPPAVTDIFGALRGTVRVTGDIVGPDPEAWGDLA